MSLEKLTDQSVIQMYESIREQAAADANGDPRYRLLGAEARRRAEVLWNEIARRHLPCSPIVWR